MEALRKLLFPVAPAWTVERLNFACASLKRARALIIPPGLRCTKAKGGPMENTRRDQREPRCLSRCHPGKVLEPRDRIEQGISSDAGPGRRQSSASPLHILRQCNPSQLQCSFRRGSPESTKKITF